MAQKDDSISGYIRKYYADTTDDYLCDDGRLADPDFFTNRRRGRNPVPTWAICGPYLRKKLKKNDVIFFVPLKNRLKKVGIDTYICTAILVVDEILKVKSELLGHRSIKAKFVQLYQRDLRDHLKKDKPSTRAIRPKNIILGNSSRSRWFGKNILDLGRGLRRLGLVELSNQIGYRQVRALTEAETHKLDRYLKSQLGSIRDESHNHLNRDDRGSCRICYRGNP